jgi:hypothetical protein
MRSCALTRRMAQRQHVVAAVDLGIMCRLKSRLRMPVRMGVNLAPEAAALAATDERYLHALGRGKCLKNCLRHCLKEWRARLSRSETEIPQPSCGWAG